MSTPRTMALVSVLMHARSEFPGTSWWVECERCRSTSERYSRPEHAQLEAARIGWLVTDDEVLCTRCRLIPTCWERLGSL